jgi:hypothetical protein
MEDKPKPVNPNRLTIEQLAKLLTSSYRQQVPTEQIEADVTAGAPTNSDGTINLAHYAAWLLQEKHRGE